MAKVPRIWPTPERLSLASRRALPDQFPGPPAFAALSPRTKFSSRVLYLARSSKLFTSALWASRLTRAFEIAPRIRHRWSLFLALASSSIRRFSSSAHEIIRAELSTVGLVISRLPVFSEINSPIASSLSIAVAKFFVGIRRVIVATPPSAWFWVLLAVTKPSRPTTIPVASLTARFRSSTFTCICPLRSR